MVKVFLLVVMDVDMKDIGLMMYNMDMGQKNIRIGFVTDGKITYSPYVQANEVTMKVVKDKQLGIDLNKLKFSDIDPDKEPTLAEKFRIQREKMEKAGQKMEW